VVTINWLLIFIPIVVALEHFWPQAHTWIFFTACVAIIPVAVLTLGIGDAMIVAVTVYASLWPILVNTIDGVRIAYPDGWALLRASNTQPALVMRFEATSAEALERYRSEMVSWLAAQRVKA